MGRVGPACKSNWGAKGWDDGVIIPGANPGSLREGGSGGGKARALVSAGQAGELREGVGWKAFAPCLGR